VPPAGEYVADGAARQAAWALAGTPTPPVWERAGMVRFEAHPVPQVRERFAEARSHHLDRI
jgi:xylulokinase